MATLRFLMVLAAGLVDARAELPLSYVCQRGDGVKIDGKLDERAWEKATWTAEFVDIEGAKKPKPDQKTQVKMLWDDQYFYFAARLEEKHLWATLKERDSIIFYDNDFEIFIDDDGDGHNYAEFEINALNTVWDLFLPRPYRAGGPPLHAWDMVGLKSAVHLEGTLNDPSDIDQAWTVEVAIPWESLKLGFSRNDHPQPKSGEAWRVNFSRVQWDLEVVDGKYRKIPDRPEHNWVWSPQGVINMHEPEHWGMVVFSDKPAGAEESVDPQLLRDELVRQIAFKIYREQMSFHKKNGRYAANLGDLDLPQPKNASVSLQVSEHGFDCQIKPSEGAKFPAMGISETGRLTK